MGMISGVRAKAHLEEALDFEQERNVVAEWRRTTA
jgi:hypothetical protein